jgi:uncharacterized protein (DUF697 family)
MGAGAQVGATHEFETQLRALTAAPLAGAVPASSTTDADLDQRFLQQAMLAGALELLPDRLANIAILPLQLKLVYEVGQRHGQQLDANQVKDLVGTFGLGAAAQVVEGMVRKMLGSVASGLLGGLLGGATGVAAGAAVTFAYLYGYRPVDPVNISGRWTKAPDAVAFVLAYLGSALDEPFVAATKAVGLEWDAYRVPLCAVTGLLGVGCFFALVILTIREHARQTPSRIALLHVLAFLLASSALTGVGRAQFPMKDALTSRYTTPSLLFWASLIAPQFRDPYPRRDLTARHRVIASRGGPDGSGVHRRSGHNCPRAYAA